ncbi:MAG: translocated intimin receptor Tir [Acidobacteria bacterium]|nr:MAG: translocated intimin receptor Tir [Acidobacteriota bacterium]PYY06084.1 MAG: translocated intimin receptor Tir [Acidobacteriota bacterium]PYY23333.1 MAG: translocated intimin receptor Tir [Acidobacteriota bacterium]
MSFVEVAKAIVTDIHFLIPVAVLIVGVALLIKLH